MRIADAVSSCIRDRKKFKLGNTRMEVDGEVAKVWLYSTCIATINYRDLVIWLNAGGHHTLTTKTRINQVLYAFYRHALQETKTPLVYQKDYNWYISWGSKRFGGHEVEFYDGVMLPDLLYRSNKVLEGMECLF